MTTAHNLLIASIFLCAVACLGGWIGARMEIRHLRKLLTDHNETVGAINDLIAAEQTATRQVGQNFLDACRIIDIRINGRSLFITCARNDETFIIETMALMSTDVREMRHNAGLDQ